MLNFQFKNPTQILFGSGQIPSLAQQIPKDANILLLYGGGSIKRNGVYDQVTEALKGHRFITFGGIPANPEYEVLLEALHLIKKEQITFLLAVGGGSVIDGTKFLAAAAFHKGKDPWQIVKSGQKIEKAMPFGTVLTLPATGSEMNSRTVITRKETQEKLSTMGTALFPQFSILDPLVIRSIPQRQIANGLADSYMHVLEQYITYPVGAYLQDRIAEGILQTLIEVSPRILADLEDYKAAANYMWSCTMALNDLISSGVPTDWTIHKMGHELTAIHDIDHARTLAILTKSHYTFHLESKMEKLAQYAHRVWNIQQGSKEEKANKGIQQTEYFFNSLGIKTRLSEYTDRYEGTAEKIAGTFRERDWNGLGEHGATTPDDVATIIKMAY